MLDAIAKRVPLNFAIMANPVNWITILLMVYIGGLAFSLIFSSSVSTGATDE